MTSKRAIGAAACLGFALFLGHALHRMRQPVSMDDAYMFLRYAKQVVAGHGYAWNPDGQQVFGATGAVHLAMVSLYEAILPLSGSAKLALSSMTFALLALAALPRVCISLLRSSLREQPWLVALAVWLVLVPHRLFISHALSGMDTMSAFAANCLVAGAALQLARTGTNRALAAAVGAALLAILARPDDGLYATLAPTFAVALGAAKPRGPLLAKTVGGLALALVVYLALGTAVFGDPVPLPFYAKSIGYFDEYTAVRAWNPFDYLGQILAMWLPSLAVIVFGVNRRTGSEVLALLAPVALTFTYYFSVVQIMGVGARYYIPATPFAIVAAAVVIDDLLRDSQPAAAVTRALASRWPLALVLTITVPAVLKDAELLYAPKFDKVAPPTFPAECYERPALGSLPDVDYNAVIAELGALAATLPPGTRLAMSEHGRIGAAAPQVMIDDLIALHDPQFAHHGFDADVELDRKPDAIWLPHYFFVRVWHDLAANPRLWSEYDVWPDAFLYGFAIRRDSPHHDRIEAGFAEIWNRLYPGLDMAAWRAMRLKSELPQCRRESRVTPGGPAKETP
jgi:hypothetical protein